MALRTRVPRRKALGSGHRTRNKNPKLSPYQRELKRDRLSNQAPSNIFHSSQLPTKEHRKKVMQQVIANNGGQRPDAGVITEDLQEFPRSAKFLSDYLQKKAARIAAAQSRRDAAQEVARAAAAKAVKDAAKKETNTTESSDAVGNSSSAVNARKRSRTPGAEVDDGMAWERRQVAIELARSAKRMEGRRAKDAAVVAATQNVTVDTIVEAAEKGTALPLGALTGAASFAKDVSAAAAESSKKGGSSSRIAVPLDASNVIAPLKSASKRVLLVTAKTAAKEAAAAKAAAGLTAASRPRDFHDIVDRIGFLDRPEAPPDRVEAPKLSAYLTRYMEKAAAAAKRKPKHQYDEFSLV